VAGQTKRTRQGSQGVGVVVDKQQVSFSRHSIFRISGFNRWPPQFLEWLAPIDRPRKSVAIFLW
jgi:hypothetical protein